MISTLAEGKEEVAKKRIL